MLDQLEAFAFHAEIDEIFHLREEQILRAAGGVHTGGKRFALLPEGEGGLTGRVVHGEIELLRRGDRGKQLVQPGKRKLFHAPVPPL